MHVWRHPVMTCLVTKTCSGTNISLPECLLQINIDWQIQLYNTFCVYTTTNFDNCTHFLFELQFLNSHQYAYTIILYMTWCILLTQFYISFDSLFSMNYESLRRPPYDLVSDLVILIKHNISKQRSFNRPILGFQL